MLCLRRRAGGTRLWMGTRSWRFWGRGWRAGLAHYRAGALAVCAQLPPALARAALGLPPDARIGLEDLIARLMADPWLEPATLAGPAHARELRIVARAGAFRGFGGLF